MQCTLACLGVATHLDETYLAIAVQWSIYPAICLQAAAEQRSGVRIDALPFTHLALKWRTGTADADADADAAAVGIAQTRMMMMMMMVMALAVIVCCCHFHVAVAVVVSVSVYVVVAAAVLLRATVRF